MSDSKQLRLGKHDGFWLSRVLGTKVVPRDCVWPGLPAGSLGSLIGPGATGKSFFALEAGMGVAGGPEADARLLGMGVAKAGPVAYLAFEDDREDIFARAQDIAGMLSPSLRERVGDNFGIFPLEGEHFDLGNPDSGDAETMKADLAGRRLIIIDTLSCVHRLNENDNGHMTALMTTLADIVKATGAAILFLHHVNKGAMRDRADDQAAGRGATALINSIRYSINMTEPTGGEIGRILLDGAMLIKSNAHLYVKVTVTKQNIGRRTEPRWYRRDPRTGVLIPVKAVTTVKTAFAARKVATSPPEKGRDHERDTYV